MILAGLVVFAAAGPPVSQSDQMLVSILVALLTGGLGSAAFSFYRHVKFGKQERDSLIADASEKAVESLAVALKQYEKDLNDAKAAIAELQDRLDSANESIAQLERDLMRAEGDRDRIAKDLTAALEKRASMVAAMERLRDRVNELELLTGSDERRRPRE